MNKKWDSVNVKIVVIGVLFCLPLLSGSYFYFYRANEYLHIGELTRYLPVTLSIFAMGTALSFSALLDKSFKHKDWKRALLVWGIIFVSLPISYQLIEPDYTFNKAQAIIHKEKNVKIIEKPIVKSRIFSAEGDHQLYRIYAKKANQGVQYAFDPYTGEYTILNF